MEYVARKYQPSKWDIDSTFMVAEDIQADAVSLCLKTSSNTLSFWRCHDDTDDLKEVALAVACKGTSIDKMHFIRFSQSDIFNLGFRLDEVPDNSTHVRDLMPRHLNLTHLTVAALSNFAHFMKDKARGDVRCHTFTAREVFDLLNNAVQGDRLKRESLDERLLKHIDRFRSP
jgi:hypothetical protein